MFVAPLGVVLVLEGSAISPSAAAIKSSCQVVQGRSDEAQAHGDFFNLQTSSVSTKTDCGSPVGGRTSGPPPVLITKTDACLPIRAGGVVNIAITCIGQGALDLQTCDPALGAQFSPTTIQTLQPDGTYSAPDLNTVLTCNRAPGTAPAAVSQADFRTLQLAPSAITVGPAQGWIPVNMITIVYTDAQP